MAPAMRNGPVMRSIQRWVPAFTPVKRRELAAAAATAPYTSSYEWLKVYWRSTGERAEDYLTTRQYCFRYNRGVTNVRPRSLVGRLLFGKLLDSTRTLWLAERLNFLLPARRPTFL